MRKPKGKGRIVKRRAGGQPTHGAYAIVLRQELIEQFPEVVRYTKDCYEGLLRDLSPDGSELSMAKRILMDQLLSQLTTVSLINSYIGRAGVLRQDLLTQLHPKTKKPQPIFMAWPIIDTWLSINRAIQSTLLALGLERAKLEPLVLTPEELMAEVVKEGKKAEQKKEKGAAPAPGGEAEAEPGQGSAQHGHYMAPGGATSEESEGKAADSIPGGQGTESGEPQTKGEIE